MVDNFLVRAAVTDFCLQYTLFVLASCLKTDRFFYLAGSATFFVTLQSAYHCKTLFPRQVIQSALVSIWGIRLGLFLTIRMWRDGHDKRFNNVKGNPLLFFLFWTVEGLWVWLMVLPTLIVNSKEHDPELCMTDFTGWTLWLVGMLIECTADYQKFIFRGDSANKEKWITSGLWAIIRHPNYFGEILVWIGLFVSASVTFTETWEYLSVASPLFITFLLTCVSGIPMLENLNQEKWKGNSKYREYILTTSRLIPYIY